ncbi:MAG: glycosyltransferase family 2 protein [Geobacteraceae bacterium]
MSKAVAHDALLPMRGGLRLNGQRKCPSAKQPLISVITVVFNGVTELAATIQSVTNQHYDNVEYLVIDGGSSDGTLDVIRIHEKEIDYWQSEPDRGVYDAMNKSIDLASGNWLLFLGAGDLLLNCLHNVAPLLRDPSIVYYGDVYMPSKHRLYDGRFSSHKLSRANIPHQAIFFPKALFDVYCFDLRYPILSDYDLNIRAYCGGRFLYRYIPVLVTIYEDREGMSSCTRDSAFKRDTYRILRENFGFLTGCEYQVRAFFRFFERRVIRKLISFVKRNLRTIR